MVYTPLCFGQSETLFLGSFFFFSLIGFYLMDKDFQKEKYNQKQSYQTKPNKEKEEKTP